MTEQAGWSGGEKKSKGKVRLQSRIIILNLYIVCLLTPHVYVILTTCMQLSI